MNYSLIYTVNSRMEEIFKPIIGYEGLYVISQLGTIFNLKTNKILKQSTHHGYKVVALRKNYKNISYRVFQLLAKAHLDSYNEYSTLIFLNGDRMDTRLENMYWKSFYIEGEVWKNVNISPYNQYYKISSLGRLLRIDTNTLVKGHINQVTGYIAFLMSAKKGVSITKTAHVLVGLTFLENPNNYPIINHIDHNKLNNNVNNLEYCTQQHNVAEGWLNNPIREFSIKKVINTLNGKIFNSIAEAARENNISEQILRKMVLNQIENKTPFKLYK